MGMEEVAGSKHGLQMTASKVLQYSVGVLAQQQKAKDTMMSF
jgi:hypothetical protein